MQQANEYSGYLEFEKKDRIYSEHFPGMPIVPGSLVIQGFLSVCRTIIGLREKCMIKAFSFNRFISPGKYLYKIRITGSTLNCILYDENDKVASGRIAL